MRTKASGQKIYVGLDLHSSNVYCAMIDSEGNRIYHKRLSNELGELIQVLSPIQQKIEGIAVESTYNWYWLVDGLSDHGFPICLSNPAKTDAYTGLKRTDDQSDAFWIAELLRLGILPKAYIYPKEQRPLRDLLRRRGMMVAQRTQLTLSMQSMIARQTGCRISGAKLKSFSQEELREWMPDARHLLGLQSQQSVIRSLDGSIESIEIEIKKELVLTGAYQRLLSLPGVAFVLGATIMLESGPIDRFASAGHYASYARAVDSRRESNGKKKGENNRKNGNRYLAWAFVEAAHYAQRFNPVIQAWFDRKAARTNRIVAIKALACKLAKAAYYVMKNDEDFDMKKMFG